MLRIFPGERFQEINVSDSVRFKYAISTYGRLVAFTTTIEEGRFIKGGLVSGLRLTSVVKINEKGEKKYKSCFYYKLVATAFLPQTSPEKCHIIHLDHNQSNDYVENLKWVTEREMMEHRKTNPRVIAGRKKTIEAAIKSDGPKLTSTQVILLKKQLANPNRKTRLKLLAKRFGISEMQMYRIKRGENWGHIKV